MVKCSWLEGWQSGVSGAIPNAMALLTDLIMLGLTKNKMSGTIPQALDSLVILRGFYLGYNKISGQIPEGTAYMKELSSLDLEVMRLSTS